MIVSHEVHIAAPIERVWEITRDVERWPEWTPTVTSVQRVGTEPFGLGSVARLRQPAQPESEWKVVDWKEGRRFAWATERTGLRMIGIHEMERSGGGTLNRLVVRAEGLLSIVLWPVLKLAVGRSLRQENAGLKRRAEEASQPG